MMLNFGGGGLDCLGLLGQRGVKKSLRGEEEDGGMEVVEGVEDVEEGLNDDSTDWKCVSQASVGPSVAMDDIWMMMLGFDLLSSAEEMGILDSISRRPIQPKDV